MAIEEQANTKTDYMAAIQSLDESLVELECVRMQSIGRQVVDYEAYSDLMILRGRMAPLARMKDLFGEARACAAFDWLLNFNLLPDFIPQDVNNVKKELRFRTGRKVDRALFHASGRLSIVEIKDACDQRAVVAGIGQALLYAALAEKEYLDRQIVPVLAVLGERDEDVARACQRGGVEYIPLGNIQYLNTLSQIVAIMVNHG